MNPRDRNHTIIDSPIGPLTLVADGGRLVALYMENHRHSMDPATYGQRVKSGFEAPVEQLGEYFAGQRRSFDLRLEPRGTPFQQRVWEALTHIPYGETRSYGELAAEIDQPGAARAVGLANGRNPLSIVVPCHRVIGASGSLTGYGGGIERKAALLDLERRVAGITPTGAADSIGQLGLLDLAHGIAG